MKKNLIRVTYFSCVLSLLLACGAKKEEHTTGAAIDNEQIKKEIQVRENEFAEVYNSRELKNIGYYANDAMIFSQNRVPIIGREAIVAYLKAGVDSSSVGNKISFLTREVFVYNEGNQVLEVGSFKLVDTAEAIINTGNYMVLFEKQDGMYKSVREMSTSDMPRM